MKKIWLLATLVGAMVAPNVFAAYDGTISLTGGPFQNGSGGEFTAHTSGLGNFQTFCIEDNEFINLPGGPYNYIINSGAVAGGVSGATTTDPHTGLSMDNISIGTAWLYSQFRAHTLANYFGANQNANAGVLQQAIWGLEGEVAYDAGNIYIQAAKTTLTLTDAQLVLDSHGAYGVVALNLYTGDPNGTPGFGNRAQDQLALVPEPTTMVAGALLLLPFGASTVRILRKKGNV
jgi:hypothetical protein